MSKNCGNFLAVPNYPTNNTNSNYYLNFSKIEDMNNNNNLNIPNILNGNNNNLNIPNILNGNNNNLKIPNIFNRNNNANNPYNLNGININNSNIPYNLNGTNNNIGF